MSISLPTREEYRTLFGLAVPVVIVQLGMMLMGVVDTIMVGHLNAAALAAVALANLYFFCIAVFGMGAVMALDPLVSQAVGAGDEAGIARSVQRGLITAFILAVPSTGLLLLVRPFLELLGQPAELIPLATRFIYVTAPGMLPFIVFLVFRQTLQALHRLAPIIVIILVANLVNAALNWVFIFGRLGAPALGVAGSALATTLSRWFMVIALLIVAWKDLGPRLIPWQRESFQAGALRRMLRLGLPIGAQMFFEYGIFGLVGTLMGRIGTLAMAGHQIALNLSSLIFMVPLGVGAAAAVLVGGAVGAEDADRARRATAGSLLVGSVFMAGAAAVFVFAPVALARFYTADRSVIDMARPLIVLAGIFAIFDGLQAVAMGVLRGIGDTRAPVAICLVGYWFVGMPTSVILGFQAGLGPVGLWWGLVAGLAVTAGVLLVRVRIRMRRALERIHIDHPEPVV
ncbi:MAG: MATE family efflux transporter [Gemmatimonadales bacterium]|nr:MATE family efflux transporter [Gemmatimonadales bacterium]